MSKIIVVIDLEDTHPDWDVIEDGISDAAICIESRVPHVRHATVYTSLADLKLDVTEGHMKL